MGIPTPEKSRNNMQSLYSSTKFCHSPQNRDRRINMVTSSGSKSTVSGPENEDIITARYNHGETAGNNGSPCNCKSNGVLPMIIAIATEYS